MSELIIVTEKYDVNVRHRNIIHYRCIKIKIQSWTNYIPTPQH